MSKTPASAPELNVDQWFNSDAPIFLEALRGRVVVIYAFQMLCPGCVSHGIPQAIKVYQTFSNNEVTVLGLHTVFEHHDAMAPQALKVFLQEYRVNFPVGVDLPSADSHIPITMQAYSLRGTPSLIVIDRQGVIRLNNFGRVDDLELGILLGTLLSEAPNEQALPIRGNDEDITRDKCDQHQCPINY